MKKIALLGPIDVNYKIFAYEAGKNGGNCMVTKCYEVYKFDYNSELRLPDKECKESVVRSKQNFPKCRGWFFIKRKGALNPEREWTDFRDYDTGNNVKPINKTGVWLPNNHWVTVIDEFEC